MNGKANHQMFAARALDIIVVDDARTQRRLLQSFLSSVGHRIRVGTDGREAYEMASRFPPDLMITDLEMPGGNGFDLIHAVRHSASLRLRRIPIIVCSSRSETFSLNHAFECGATSFVTKPLHQSELQLAIENLQTS